MAYTDLSLYDTDVVRLVQRAVSDITSKFPEWAPLEGSMEMVLLEAFSMMVTCSSQDEIDRLWDELSSGGTPSQCGWVTDRYGVTWQVIPERLREWLADPERGQAVAAQMLQMVKIEIAPLEAALHSD